MMEKMFSVNEVAKMLDKTPVAVRKIVARFNIGTKVGRDWVLSLEDIEKLKSHRGAGRPKLDKKK